MADSISITGLSDSSCKKITDLLNDLLANYQILYLNVRGYHWNIRGSQFFELHRKFEEVYNELIEQIDDIAERTLTLGHTPDHTYSAYLKKTAIKEHSNATDPIVCVKGLLDGLLILLDKQRDIIHIAMDEDDEGTVDLLSDYIFSQEKLAWMLKAYLS